MFISIFFFIHSLSPNQNIYTSHSPNLSRNQPTEKNSHYHLLLPCEKKSTSGTFFVKCTTFHRHTWYTTLHYCIHHQAPPCSHFAVLAVKYFHMCVGKHDDFVMMIFSGCKFGKKRFRTHRDTDLTRTYGWKDRQIHRAYNQTKDPPLSRTYKPIR